MSIRTRLQAGVVAAVAAALALSGCSSAPGTSNTASDAASQTLTIANPSALMSFDPALVTSGSLDQYLQPVFETLIRRTPSLELVPMLATEWKYDDSLTKLTFTLREGAKFSDGTPVTPEAVAKNLLRTRDANGPQASSLAEIADVQSAGADSVALTLNKPDPGLLVALSGTAGFIASPESLTSASVNTTPVGSGPYVLDASRTTTGDTYTYTANPDYAGPSLAPFGTIVIKTLEDVTARMNAIRSGQVQATMVEIPQIKEAESAGLTVHTQLLNFTGFMIFDRAGAVVPALGDVRVRQAINYAIDGKTLLNVLRDGRGVATSQLFGEQSEAFVASLDSHYPYDAAKAKSLLAEAGYKDGIDVTLPDFSPIFGESLFAAVTEQLQAVGIRVTLESLPIPDMIGKTMSGGYAMSLISNYQGTAWDTVARFLLPNSAFNPFHSTDATTESMISTIRTASGEAQLKAYRDLNQYVVDEAWAAPFFREDGVYLSNGTVQVTLQPQTQVPAIYNFTPVK